MADTQHNQTRLKFTSLDKSGSQKPLEFSLPEEASAQVKRVAVRFALLDATGELATLITGWSREECHAAIKQSFDDWLADFGIGNREKYQVITRARDFIQKYGLSRFQPYTYGRLNGDIDTAHAMRINGLAGYLVVISTGRCNAILKQGGRDYEKKKTHLLHTRTESGYLGQV